MSFWFLDERHVTLQFIYCWKQTSLKKTAFIYVFHEAGKPVISEEIFAIKCQEKYGRND